jgi:hypothetical protein
VLTRAAASPAMHLPQDFNLGIRLSPERFGLKLGEVLPFVQVCVRLYAIHLYNSHHI